MKKLIYSIAIATTLFSCTNKITDPIQPQQQKVESGIQTNARKYNMLSEGVTHNRNTFFELKTHTFNTDNLTIGYSEGVNNQGFYEQMDSYQYNFDSTSVTFKKTYANQTQLVVSYFNTDSVFEFRYFPSASGNKRTSFFNN